MFFTTPLSLLLALAPTALFAAPTPATNIFEKRSLSAVVVQALSNGACDMSKIVMPAATIPLPPPTTGLTLSHIAVGRGTQNYTCRSSSPAEVPVATGAMATLYNATCSIVRAPAVVSDMAKLSLGYPVPTGDIADAMLSGHHEFNAAGSPYFSLKTSAHDFGELTAKKAANSTAPAGAPKGVNGQGSVPWLKLTATAGSLKEVYRINTAGGNPPPNCDGITGAFTVEYAAEYWFYA